MAAVAGTDLGEASAEAGDPVRGGHANCPSGTSVLGLLSQKSAF
jgi:hypothetical protein